MSLDPQPPRSHRQVAGVPFWQWALRTVLTLLLVLAIFLVMAYLMLPTLWHGRTPAGSQPSAPTSFPSSSPAGRS